MKINSRTGMLLTLLVVPVFFYFVVFFFGFNRDNPSLPYYFPVGDTTYSVEGVEVKDTFYHTVPDFNFVNQLGKNVTSSTVEGKIKVVNYIFTRCGKQCPDMTSKMQDVYETFRGETDVVILSHTVDPEYDTPEVLNDYANQYNISSDNWFFLTGDKEALYKQAYKGYKISALEDDTVEGGFLHSDKVLLIDKENHVRGFYTNTDFDEIKRLITEIGVLQTFYTND